MSSRNYKKLFVFVIFLVLCLSVSYAANVTDDSTTDKIDTSVTAAETPSIEKESNIAKQTVKKEQNIKKESTRHIPGDPYTFANETLDITNNQYDGHTLTLLDNVNVSSSNNFQLTSTAFLVSGNNVNINGLNIKNYNWNSVAITVTGSNVNINGNFFNITRTEAGDGKGIKLLGADNVTITDNNINGYGTYYGDIEGVYIFNTANTVLSNNNIAINGHNLGYTKGVSIIESEDITVSNNVVNVSAVPQSSEWTNETGEWLENMKVSGIKAEQSSDIIINDNTVTVTNSTIGTQDSTSTDAITIKTCNDSTIENNTVNITGSDYVYGISATRLNNNITIFNNTAYLDGDNYICGIQFASTSNSKIKQNKIYGTCTATSGECPSYEAFAYGIIDLTGTWGSPVSEAVGNIIEENNVELTSTVAYAYELSNTDQTQILNNNATITGSVVMGLGIYNSTNSNITGNKFNITGNTRSLHPYIYEAVYPVTTGIKLVDEGSTNIRITENVIDVTETTATLTFAVIIEDAMGNYVTGNTLKSYDLMSGSKIADGAVYTNMDERDNEIANNN